MIIKVQNKSKVRMPIYPCDRYNITELPHGSGLEIELVGGPEDGRKVTLPDDGNKAFVENDQGDTIDSYTWPPVKKVKELRV